MGKFRDAKLWRQSVTVGDASRKCVEISRATNHLGAFRVFEFLRSRKYREETLPAIRGEDHDIEVAFEDYPIRVSDDQQQKRIEYYPDFNTRLLHAIWDAIGNYAKFAERALIEPVSLTVTVKNAPTFLCEIRMKTAKSKRLFTGELPDAIIAALKSNSIGR